MKPVSTLRMRLWLPLGIFGIYVVALLFSAVFQHHAIRQELEKNALTEVNEMLANTGRRTEALLRQNDADLVAEEVADVGVNVHIRSFVLLDEDARILEATRRDWRGLPAVGTLPHFDLARFRAAQQSRRQRVYTSAGGRDLYGYQPVVLAPGTGEIRSSRIGALVLDYDLTADRAGLWEELLHQRLAIWSVTLGMVLGLLWLLAVRVLQPLKVLTEAVRRFGAGEQDVDVRIAGKGELAELGAAWNWMHAQLAATLEQLDDSRENLEVTLFSIGDAVIATDMTGNVTRMNGVAQQLTGWTQKDAAGLPLPQVFRIINAHTREPADDPVQRVLATGKIAGLANHTVLIARDGAEYQIADSAAPIRHENGRISGVVLVFRDVTEEYLLREELRIAATAFDTQEGIMVSDADNVILRVNAAFTSLTGYAAHEVVGQTPAMLRSGEHDEGFYQALWETLAQDHYWQGEIWNRHKSGEVCPVWLTVTTLLDDAGKVANYVSSLSDIRQFKRAEEQIHKLAYFDALTGLPNRRMLYDRLKQAIALTGRTHGHGAILFIDLDNFKIINDTRGHDVGDMLLIEVSQRLQSCVRGEDTVARLGGDEFVLMVDRLSDSPDQVVSQIEAVGEKVLQLFARPFVLDGKQHYVTPSIGVSLFHDPGITVDELLKRADTAMYQAKQSGRNAIRFFDPAMQNALEVRVAMESDLRNALSERQFELYYQPQVDLERRVLGAEVLLRWHHPERGMVSPTEFIPLAEESWQILPIGKWVLEAACMQIKQWESAAATRALQLAVNVSARQFRQDDFVDQVRWVLLQTEIDPSRLKLELTESLVIENVNDAIAKMQVLKTMGVRFSMDDFGTGHSSLAALKKLPLDQLKIDQSFVRDIASDPDDAVIAQTIVAMARNLGLDVIAEGVETEEQRVFLQRCGCPAYQGYLFGRPVPIREFEADFLRAQAS
ncbi:cyclic di-GMP phosphodiesterase Gmr [mine drainage metagenome]|uniref:Cyclic di-GMP phosphodiesterase Gmr n=1 Tax=mine drainage metagenome TaxID=410659 RepID=A0A1J5R507_9ZZZZ